jgi:hypothetical protein
MVKMGMRRTRPARMAMRPVKVAKTTMKTPRSP